MTNPFPPPAVPSKTSTFPTPILTVTYDPRNNSRMEAPVTYNYNLTVEHQFAKGFLSRVAYVGHSLGGNASFEACSRDSRCVGAVSLDGTIFSDVRRTGMKVPALILQANTKVSCDDFCQRRKDDFKSLTASGPVRDLAVDGVEHLNFSDNSVMFMPLLRPVGQLGTIDGARGVLITRDVVGAFLDQVIRGTPAPTLEATIGRYPELHAP
jgi:hypothetical protein